MLVGETDKFSEYLAVIDYEEYTVLIGLVTPSWKKNENIAALGFIVSQIKPMMTTILGMPNLSQMLLPNEDFYWEHPS